MSTATALINQPLAGPFGAKAGKPGYRYKTDSSAASASARRCAHRACEEDGINGMIPPLAGLHGSGKP